MASAPTERTVDGITYIITRKHIKSMYLRIRPSDGAVMVSAPYGMPQPTMDTFVTTHRAWIDSTREKMIRRRESRELDSLGHHTDTNLSPRELFKLKWTPERTAQATAYLEARIPPLLAIWTTRVGRAPTHITYRAMSSRWGSCTPATGRIRLSLELADVPEPLMEYVLVHELVHLWEPGHGAGFQRRMTQLMPDWKQRRHALNALWIYS
ncbi:MAG: SprT family zinc-dependent metalloprotease [Bifidobacteriaceae bacterium]|nr:SprT family zinc-dependent metalloprotease [Bifidobacteriaceae bacterium]